MAEGDEIMRVRWRTVALVSVVIALTTAILLAIVSSIREADALSVIALALAVTAFAVQIIVYVAQAEAASRQQVQASDIYGKTISALTAIEEKAEGTRTTVNTLSDKLLDAAIGKALPEAESGGAPVGSDEFAETVSKIVREIINSPSRETEGAGQPEPGDRPRRLTDPSMMEVPEGERLAAALDAIVGFGPSELLNLERLAADQHRSGGSRGTRIGPGVRTLFPGHAEKYYDKGLVVRRRVPWSSDPVFQLTDLGKDVGRILLMKDPSAVQDARAHQAQDTISKYKRQLRTPDPAPAPAYENIPIAD